MQELLSRGVPLNAVEADERPSVALVIKHYAVSVGLYGALLVFLALNPWFKGLLSGTCGGINGQEAYRVLFLLYVLAALPVYLWLRPRSLRHSKNLVVFRLACRTPGAVAAWFRGTAPWMALSDEERNALMFQLIKLFFGPLMLSSLFLDLNWCQKLSHAMHPISWVGRFDLYYIFFVHAVFALDAGLFFVGYHTEAAFMKNEVRYVETKLWRILVCIMCYAPFNSVTLSLFGSSYQDPYLLVGGDYKSVWTWGLRVLAVVFLCLLTSASLSLFTRASNLTNRGIVSWGPYRYVRHPGYLAKNLFWLVTLIPWLIPEPHSDYFSWWHYFESCLCIVCGFLVWGTIYFLRAISEEEFLSRDPEYVAYCKQVKYRFIPGVY
jgi:protein-S-isoprenylcysteine O-methyltransferase Ste14